ncbi:glutathione transferase FuA class [Trametes sanguinea]|nr:glutathione transferase FuA class [Trametes sanguinea]
MADPLIFYDIPGNVEGIAWSPNTWRVRYTLNYKQLPYATTWVEYPSIARTCQSIGAEPTSTWPTGEPMYTLPAIYDPNTSTGLAGSLAIALYLDHTYPDTPPVVPEGTAALQAAFEVAFNEAVSPQVQMLVMPVMVEKRRLHDESRGYYKNARESQWGGCMEEWAPRGSEVREAHWRGLREGFGRVKRWLDDGRRFFMGDCPSFADFVVAGRLMWIKKILGSGRRVGRGPVGEASP